MAGSSRDIPLSPCFGVILGIPSYRQLSPEGTPSTERAASGPSMKEMATAPGRTCQGAFAPSLRVGDGRPSRDYGADWEERPSQICSAMGKALQWYRALCRYV